MADMTSLPVKNVGCDTNPIQASTDTSDLIVEQNTSLPEENTNTNVVDNGDITTATILWCGKKDGDADIEQKDNDDDNTLSTNSDAHSNADSANLVDIRKVEAETDMNTDVAGTVSMLCGAEDSDLTDMTENDASDTKDKSTYSNDSTDVVHVQESEINADPDSDITNVASLWCGTKKGDDATNNFDVSNTMDTDQNDTEITLLVREVKDNTGSTSEITSATVLWCGVEANGEQGDIDMNGTTENGSLSKDANLKTNKNRGMRGMHDKFEEGVEVVNAAGRRRMKVNEHSDVLVENVSSATENVIAVRHAMNEEPSVVSGFEEEDTSVHHDMIEDSSAALGSRDATPTEHHEMIEDSSNVPGFERDDTSIRHEMIKSALLLPGSEKQNTSELPTVMTKESSTLNGSEEETSSRDREMIQDASAVPVSENAPVIMIDTGTPGDSREVPILVEEAPETVQSTVVRKSGSAGIASLVADYRGDSSDSFDSSSESESTDSTSSCEFLNEVRNKRAKARDSDEERAFQEKPKTKGELLVDDLPPIEDLCITVDEQTPLLPLGKVASIVGNLVVVQSEPNTSALDMDSIIFTEDRKSLGQIFETFGPVKSPLYSIRFNSVQQIEEKEVEVGMMLFCAPSVPDYTHFVFMTDLQKMKGSDASWWNNNEPPERLIEYSDDEEERFAKRSAKEAALKRSQAMMKSGATQWPPDDEDRDSPDSCASGQAGTGRRPPKRRNRKPREGQNRSSAGPSGAQPQRRSGPQVKLEPDARPRVNVPQPRFGAPPMFGGGMRPPPMMVPFGMPPMVPGMPLVAPPRFIPPRGPPMAVPPGGAPWPQWMGGARPMWPPGPRPPVGQVFSSQAQYWSQYGH